MIRFFLLSIVHYRSPIQYSEELLAENGAQSLDTFYRFFKRLHERITGQSFFETEVPGQTARQPAISSG